MLTLNVLTLNGIWKERVHAHKGGGGGGSQIKIKTERNKSVLNHTKKNKNKSRLQTLQNTENTLGLNKSEKGIIK